MIEPHLLGKIRIALDPGGTTGIAVRFPDGSWTTTVTTDPPSLWKFFQEPRPDEVIFELFSTMGRVDRYMLYTVELVGGIKALCTALQIQGYAQTPQQRLGHIERAKEMLESRKAEHRYVVHEVDALAHLLRYEYRLLHGAAAAVPLPAATARQLRLRTKSITTETVRKSKYAR